MNMQKPVRKGSILERAADMFGLDAAFKGPVIDVAALPADPEVQPAMVPLVTMDVTADAAAQLPAVTVTPAPVEPAPAARPAAPRAKPVTAARHGTIDRALLAAQGCIDPDGKVSGLSEEYRIVKREIIRSIDGTAGRPPIPRGHRVLVASANPGDGKSFTAINLALSLAAETDHEVLLVDADFAKPSVVKMLGLEDGPGLMDVLADASLSLSDCIIQTDLAGLKVLPAGRATNRDTELIASARTESVLAQLEAGAPGRIVIFDSPPVLAASPASVLAAHVGQLILVVRADVTTEASLRDAVGLLASCPHIQLLLNGVKFSPGGRRFGTYYGQESST